MVHDCNKLLVSLKVESLLFCNWGAWTSVEGVSSSRINNCSASQAWTGPGCESLALGWPPAPAWVAETTHAHLQGWSLCLEFVSPTLSKCVCLGLSLGTLKARGKFRRCWRGTVWCGVLHGVWRCHVAVQCPTTFDARNKAAKKKKKSFYF